MSKWHGGVHDVIAVFGLFFGNFTWLATLKKFLFPDGTGLEWIETVVRLLAQLTLNVS